jgi:hypothetical protein
MCHRSGRTEFYRCTQVEVMNERVDSLGEQYAVIEAGHGGCPERFVLAYREEKSLRDLIAAPSIVALGFASREQAVANIEDCLLAVAARAQVPTATIENRRDKCQHRCHPAKRRFGGSFSLAETPTMVKSGFATWRRRAHSHRRLQERCITGSSL